MAQEAIRNPADVPPWVKRKAMGPVRHRAERAALNRKREQRAMLDELRRDDYLLIVLDACRFDVLAEAFFHLFDGTPEAVASEGYDTFQYVRRCWPEEYPVTTYISGATPVSSKESFEFEDRGLQELYQGYVPSRHIGEIVDMWDHGWDASLGTCPPEAVLGEALERLDERRLVVHFFQPHAPYIGQETELGHADDGSATPGDGEPVDAPLWRRIRTGEMSDDRLRDVYRANLERALWSVCRLIRELRERGDDRRIVVMGDHGEALGEYGVYSHPRKAHPKIRVVPWWEVEGLSENGQEYADRATVDSSGESVGGDDQSRLRSLGYL
jgi:hypothetical protein